MSASTSPPSPSSPPQQQNDTALRRLEALSSTLSSSNQNASSSASSPDSPIQSIPAIRTVAGPSTGPRTPGFVVIVTGANSVTGIGRATAHQFAQSGARAVYVCDYADEYLATHKSEIEAAQPGCTVHPVKLDVGDEAAVKGVVEDAVARYGRLDVMFANAGVSGSHFNFEGEGADVYTATMRVNALGVFLCWKYGALAMKKCIKRGAQRGGSLIGTASVAGLRSNAGGLAYSASKAAVINMAQTLAYQLTGTGIRVNAICPGLIDTGMTSQMFEMARARGTEGKIGQLNPTRRGGVADEIARVALFLGSDEASYVNGQAWAVDGGLSAGHPFVPGKMA